MTVEQLEHDLSKVPNTYEVRFYDPVKKIYQTVTGTIINKDLKTLTIY